MWQGIHETHRLLVDNENILEKVHLHRVNFYVKRGHSTGKRYLHVIANDYGLPVSKKEVIYYRHGVLLTIYTQKNGNLLTLLRRNIMYDSLVKFV